MTTRMRQPFTPGGKFVVSKPFRFAGKGFNVGDEFPWRQLSCSVRRLRLLYEGRHLNNSYIDDEEQVLSSTVESATTVVDTGGGGGGIEGAKALAEVTFDPEIHEIVSPEKGKWYMDLEGKHLFRLSSAEAKRLRKLTEPGTVDSECIMEDE